MSRRYGHRSAIAKCWLDQASGVAAPLTAPPMLSPQTLSHTQAEEPPLLAALPAYWPPQPLRLPLSLALSVSGRRRSEISLRGLPQPARADSSSKLRQATGQEHSGLSCQMPDVNGSCTHRRTLGASI